jgi:hypothetical protein
MRVSPDVSRIAVVRPWRWLCLPAIASLLAQARRAGHRATVPRDWIPYLNSTSQGPTTEDARLPALRAYSSERRTVISAVAVTPGRDEISGLGLEVTSYADL